MNSLVRAEHDLRKSGNRGSLRDPPPRSAGHYPGDCSSAGFRGNLRALEMVHESGLIIPFIVLTGAVGDEQVVEYMKKAQRTICEKTEF